MRAELWGEVDRDFASARRLTNAVSHFRSKGFGHRAVDEADEMAFMHVMRSGYTSFEAGLKRILSSFGMPTLSSPA